MNTTCFDKYLPPNPPESKLILALNRIEANRADVRVRTSRMEEGDPTYWREYRDGQLRRENARLARRIERMRRCRVQ